ncbi:response regulator transcription factor [Microvirga sp. VF16]|uniref:LuxR C-terminal-related transcriptional regulator n=1 Tax=Microvirga sp. VF16 TaxID=2807101 RepID=UPI00193D4DC1|nr:response regulator transcription factor [Microvirga sp. VF16]QRM27654.1 response regulator transcription factor [Microvirga sp. VF16]
MSSSGRVGLVADDDAYFRMAVGTILNRQFGFADVVEAASLDEALDCLSENASISTALFDLSMPGMRTPANLRAVRECFPDTRIAVISGSSSRRDILLALEAGVHGYMPKSLSIKDLAGALKTVFDGGIYVPASLADISSMPVQPMVQEPSEAALPDGSKTAPPLTPRQQDVLDLLIRGKSNKEIALALGLGEGTVKIHMAAIFRYFGVNNRAAAAVAGARPYPNRKRNLLGG